MSGPRSKSKLDTASPASLVDYLTGLITAALAAEMNHTALFLAERLTGILPQEESAAYHLSLALLRTGNAQGALHVLKTPVHPPSKSAEEPLTSNTRMQTRQMSSWRQEQAVMKPAAQISLRCAWIYSRACLEVGRPVEAQDTLDKALTKFTAKGPINPADLQLPSVTGPNMAALYITKAQSCVKAQLLDEAAKNYEKALQDTWWCIEAFDGLCFLGKPPDVDLFFASKLPNGYNQAAAYPVTNGATRITANSLFSPVVTNTNHLIAFPSTSTATYPLPGTSLPINQSFDSTNTSFEASFTAQQMNRQASSSSSSQPFTSNQGFFTPPSYNVKPNLGGAAAPNRKFPTGVNPKDAVRRSTRLTGTSASLNMNGLPNDAKQKNKEPRSRVASNPRDRKRAKASSSPPPLAPSPSNNIHPVSSFSGNAYAQPAITSTNSTSSAMPENPEEWLRNIYRKFGKAEASLSRFEGSAAIESVMTLSIDQRRSWRASVIIGRARMEALDYAGAEKAFAAAREAAPYMIVYSDLHSTLLWHLSKSTDLSYLAQQVMALNPLTPEAWTCTGNVFSLLDDHANGLKCFKRAIQLVESDHGSVSRKASGSLTGNSAGEYAFVMAGHECVALEEWENALGFFREAIRRKPRCYTAWFGLGNVYMKTGKLRLAEYHFQKAVAINSNNAMLVSCVGSIMEKLGKRKEALETYDRACVLAPQSAAVHFKRVKLLVHLKKYKSALQSLLSLAALAPDEFNVQFLLGKVYGHLGNRTQMTKHFTFAQDLDPRSAQRVREAIESIAFANVSNDEPMDES